MILTVSLNPAVDKTCRLEKLEVGEVNRFVEVKNVAGGKGVNVAKVLACLYALEQGVKRNDSRKTKAFSEEEVVITGFVGGANGQFIQSVLESKGIRCEFVETRAQTRVNTNVIVANGSVTELLEPGEAVAAEEKERFLLQFEQLVKDAKVIVMSGSLPPGVETDFYGKLIRICHAHNKIVMLDASKEALKEGVAAKPDYIKPNEKELETLLGRKFSAGDNGEEIIEAAKELIRQGVKNVVVSRGQKGILYVKGKLGTEIEAEEFVVFKGVPPKIEPVNTVGCGDSAVAALAKGVIEKLSDEKLVENMIDVSVANALSMENGEIEERIEIWRN